MIFNRFRMIVLSLSFKYRLHYQVFSFVLVLQTWA